MKIEGCEGFAVLSNSILFVILWIDCTFNFVHSKIDNICENLEYTQRLIDIIEGKVAAENFIKNTKRACDLCEIGTQVSDIRLCESERKSSKSGNVTESSETSKKDEDLGDISEDNNMMQWKDLTLKQKLADFRKNIRGESSRTHKNHFGYF